ncbi:hypothetical protein EYZ11_013537 [Aspergillus tanneri]|uniref:RRM domain-containing protein n=1 Tax=Aspergillus tanneri TaxID=1220188 RepID=A0A4S3IZK6_9EURO|nr:hypothetical protein EYZ11_013537 [Aspergillus tanneri]
MSAKVYVGHFLNLVKFLTHKGFGFVTFSSGNEADAAIVGLHEQE